MRRGRLTSHSYSYKGPTRPSFTADLVELRRGLSSPRPWISAHHHWDRRGVTLHRQRTRASDFYPARVEAELLAEHARTIVAVVQPLELVDVAPGASRALRALLAAMDEPEPRCAVLADPGVLTPMVLRLASDFPHVDVRGVAGGGPREASQLGRGRRRLWLASAAGLDGPDPVRAENLLGRLGRRLGTEDVLLLSLELGRDPGLLSRAWAGSDAFYRNVLDVVNRRFGADFQPDAFVPEVAWRERFLEVRLRPGRGVKVEVAGAHVPLDPDRPLVTARVGRWSRPRLARCARRAGMTLFAWFTDPDELRAIALLRRA